MFGKFLGKQNQKSSLPKNQIEVICPLCGAVQREPRLVVTTFCRSCGEHLRIENNRVIASSKINQVPRAISPTISESEVDLEAVKVTDKATEKSALGDSVRSSRTSRFKTNEKGAASSPTPTPQSTLLKMKEQGSNQQHHFQSVECFDCQHIFKVGRSAKSTNCPACGVYVCLENFEINMNSITPIHTRGDVLIRKNGNLSTSEIYCRNLTVHGCVSGNIDCTGEFMISASGNHIGNVRCHRIVIEKGSDIHFLNTIVAHDVEVRARVFGNIQCHGPVLITATGWVHGDVTAHSVSIQPGGQLDGVMNILRSNSSALPLPLPKA